MLTSTPLDHFDLIVTQLERCWAKMAVIKKEKEKRSALLIIAISSALRKMPIQLFYLSLCTYTSP